jgi:hypothetical protein
MQALAKHIGPVPAPVAEAIFRPILVDEMPRFDDGIL